MTGRVFAATEAISIEEAIRSYTITGAYINFQEDLKGSLESGKFADMIVVSDDILSIDPDKIMWVANWYSVETTKIEDYKSYP